ncbi:hypothetical protein ACFPVT_00900 [Corynebacterium choanae]|uniref:Uncharacterized protein n=1 Tax=Corynebacterium choanae TaxID=1862358 RepID=A0A3G6J5B6_9CORY|nr:hypothetical protein [Corynebacterium choanae]AZA13281.1 hypothetical protein CCHOA_04360 [Corynebacterium choanae]
MFDFSLPQRQQSPADLLTHHPTADLSTFVQHTSITLADLYRAPGVIAPTATPEEYPDSFTSWRYRCGLASPVDADMVTQTFLLRRLRRLLHIDDGQRAAMYASLLGSTQLAASLSQSQMRAAAMLVGLIFSEEPHEYDNVAYPGTIDAALAMLRSQPDVVAEATSLLSLLPVMNAQPETTEPAPVAAAPSWCGLTLHAHYTAAELYSAISSTPQVSLAHWPETINYFEHEQSTVGMIVTTIDPEAGQLAGNGRVATAISQHQCSLDLGQCVTADTRLGRALADDLTTAPTLLLAAGKPGTVETPSAEYEMLGTITLVESGSVDDAIYTVQVTHPLPQHVCRRWLSCGC